GDTALGAALARCPPGLSPRLSPPPLLAVSAEGGRVQLTTVEPSQLDAAQSQRPGPHHSPAVKQVIARPVLHVDLDDPGGADDRASDGDPSDVAVRAQHQRVNRLIGLGPQRQRVRAIVDEPPAVRQAPDDHAGRPQSNPAAGQAVGGEPSGHSHGIHSMSLYAVPDATQSVTVAWTRTSVDRALKRIDRKS